LDEGTPAGPIHYRSPRVLDRGVGAISADSAERECDD
jgi:hypothetical protein